MGNCIKTTSVVHNIESSRRETNPRWPDQNKVSAQPHLARSPNKNSQAKNGFGAQKTPFGKKEETIDNHTSQNKESRIIINSQSHIEPDGRSTSRAAEEEDDEDGMDLRGTVTNSTVFAGKMRHAKEKADQMGELPLSSPAPRRKWVRKQAGLDVVSEVNSLQEQSLRDTRLGVSKLSKLPSIEVSLRQTNNSRGRKQSL